MATKKRVSGRTHTVQQLNDYANQHNPNNKAFKAIQKNKSTHDSRKQKNQKYDYGILDGESYGWCDD